MIDLDMKEIVDAVAVPTTSARRSASTKSGGGAAAWSTDIDDGPTDLARPRHHRL